MRDSKYLQQELDAAQADLECHVGELKQFVEDKLETPVALVGLGILCLTVLFALQLAIEAAWLRVLIMSVVYLVIGGVAVGAARSVGKRDVGDQIDERGDVVNNGLAH